MVRPVRSTAVADTTAIEAEPVMAAATWSTAPSAAASLDAALTAMAHVASTFRGHRGVDVFRQDRQDRVERHVVVRFASPADLRRWERSPQRQACDQRIRDVGADQVRFRRLTGLEAWFDLPAAGDRPPKRWRMALLTWMAAFLIAAAIYATLGSVLAREPLLLRALVVTAILVGSLTYVALPLLTRLLHRWLT